MSTAVTKIPNLVAFNEELAKDLADGTRQIALVAVDLDGFKEINDLHGHLIGDLVLTEVAHRLGDMFVAPDRIYRIGGDEFAAILSHRQNLDLEIIATSIRHSMKRPIAIFEDATLCVGASVGFAHREHTDSAASLYKRADAAMYEDKRKRKQAGPV